MEFLLQFFTRVKLYVPSSNAAFCRKDNISFFFWRVRCYCSKDVALRLAHADRVSFRNIRSASFCSYINLVVDRS